jgi:hypothetical protein
VGVRGGGGCRDVTIGHRPVVCYQTVDGDRGVGVGIHRRLLLPLRLLQLQIVLRHGTQDLLTYTDSVTTQPATVSEVTDGFRPVSHIPSCRVSGVV